MTHAAEAYLAVIGFGVLVTAWMCCFYGYMLLSEVEKVRKALEKREDE